MIVKLEFAKKEPEKDTLVVLASSFNGRAKAVQRKGVGFIRTLEIRLEQAN